MYAGSSEPEGWLFCDGRQLPHTGTGNYSELYAAIGFLTQIQVNLALLVIKDLLAIFLEYRTYPVEFQ